MDPTSFNTDPLGPLVMQFLAAHGLAETKACLEQELVSHQRRPPLLPPPLCAHGCPWLAAAPRPFAPGVSCLVSPHPCRPYRLGGVHFALGGRPWQVKKGLALAPAAINFGDGDNSVASPNAIGTVSLAEVRPAVAGANVLRPLPPHPRSMKCTVLEEETPPFLAVLLFAHSLGFSSESPSHVIGAPFSVGNERRFQRTDPPESTHPSPAACGGECGTKEMTCR